MGDDFASGFVVGFVAGFITAGAVGFAVKQMLWCWGRVAAIRKPQGIKSSTDKTPWQVLVDGCKSLLTLIIVIILVLVGIFLCGAVTIDWEEVISFVRSMAQP